MALKEFTFQGNIVAIRQAGKNKVISLAQYVQSKEKDAKSPIFPIMTFERQADTVAHLEEAQAAAQAETGRENAALQNVRVLTRAVEDQNHNVQLQLVRVISVGGQKVETPAAAAAEA